MPGTLSVLCPPPANVGEWTAPPSPAQRVYLSCVRGSQHCAPRCSSCPLPTQPQVEPSKQPPRNLRSLARPLSS